MYKAKKLTYRANYATGFRSPSLKELYMNWDHLGMFEIVGNEDLKPETNNYFSFATELITKRLNTSVTLYHNRFDNKIELTETNSELYEYTNFDYANISGMDVNAKYRILDDLSISGGYTYLLEDYSSKIVRVTAASPHSGNIRLEYKIRKGFYDAIINLNGKFYGAKNFTAGEDIIYNGEEIYAEFPINYTAYSMWKISITQRLFNSVNAVFIVDNLLNNTSNVVSYSSNLSPGRRFSIGLDINLDRLYQYIKSNH
jgi:outer membrane receptor for ferrienterochelin and colicins